MKKAADRIAAMRIPPGIAVPAPPVELAVPVAPTEKKDGRRLGQGAVLGAGLVLIGVGIFVLSAQGWRLAALFGVGGAIGLTLHHAGIGFTTAYRKLFVSGETSGIAAQLLMLAVASLLFAPILASGSVFGRGVVGAMAPVGLRVAIGAFLFGAGMQLGCACGSGTLSAIGSGSLRTIVTLIAFSAGGFWASLDMGFWSRLPSLGPISLGDRLGWGPAVLVQLAFLGILALALRRWGARRAWAKPAPPRHIAAGGATGTAAGTATGTAIGTAPRLGVARHRLLRGPWPLVAGALALAGLNLATLMLAGHPWTITWGFTLWAAKVAAALGWDPAGSAFWTAPFQSAALKASVLSDITSVMNLGTILGAVTAAALARRFVPRFPLSLPGLVAVIVGGLMMGYGARLAFGCNIGAFFSGVASFSLHGWLWIVFALGGTAVGIRLRPVFGFANERPAGGAHPATAIESGRSAP